PSPGGVAEAHRRRRRGYLFSGREPFDQEPVPVGSNARPCGIDRALPGDLEQAAHATAFAPTRSLARDAPAAVLANTTALCGVVVRGRLVCGVRGRVFLVTVERRRLDGRRARENVSDDR